MNQPLAETIFWIAVVASVIAQIAILRSTFAVRRADKSDLVPAASRVGDLAWAFLPAIALAWVLIAARQRMHARGDHMQMQMDHSAMQHAMLTGSPVSGQE